MIKIDFKNLEDKKINSFIKNFFTKIDNFRSEKKNSLKQTITLTLLCKNGLNILEKQTKKLILSIDYLNNNYLFDLKNKKILCGIRLIKDDINENIAKLIKNNSFIHGEDDIKQFLLKKKNFRKIYVFFNTVENKKNFNVYSRKLSTQKKNSNINNKTLFNNKKDLITSLNLYVNNKRKLLHYDCSRENLFLRSSIGVYEKDYKIDLFFENFKHFVKNTVKFVEDLKIKKKSIKKRKSILIHDLVISATSLNLSMKLSKYLSIVDK